MKRIIQLTFAWLLVITSSQAYSQQVACIVKATANPDTVLCGDTINLTALGIGGVPIANLNFNNGTIGSGWITTAGVDFTNPCGSSGTSGTYLWMGDGTPAPRSLTTIPMDLSCGATVCFDVRFALQGGATPCEGPDLTNEGVFLQYSTNAGGSWSTIHYFDPDTLGSGGGATSPLTQWQNYCFQIPPLTTTTQLRWAQTSVSGNNFDHWGLNNVQLFSNCGNPYSYMWEGIGNVQDTFVHQITTDTSFIVSYYNASDTCYDTVSVHILPRIPLLASSDVTLCNTVNAIDAQLSATGASSYDWTIVSGGDPISNATFGCDTCGTTWAHPTVSTTYVVSGDLTGICYETDSVTVNIVSAFDASFQYDSSYCYTESFVTLSPNISGGVWRGTGITDSINGLFNPSQVGVGSHPISYNILGACANSDTIELNVVEPLDPFFNMPDYICKESDPIQLTPFYLGGHFSGLGVTSAGIFNPNIVGNLPSTDITYSINNGCIASSTKTLNLYSYLPLSYLTSSNIFEICANENSFSLIDSVETVLPVPHRLIFTGNVQDSLTGLIDPATLDLGSPNYISVTASDTSGKCYSNNGLFFSIDVNNVNFLKLIEKKHLVIDAFKELVFNIPVTSTDLDNLTIKNRTLTTNTDTIVFHDEISYIWFNPSGYGVGSWELEFTYTNAEGCTGVSYDTLYIQEPLSLTDSKQSLVELFPNPFMEELSIRLGSNVKEVIVYNELGQIVWRNVISSGRYELSINSENWGIGVYTVLIRDNNGKLETEKVVKFE